MMKLRLPVGSWNWLHVLAAVAAMLLASSFPTWLSTVLGGDDISGFLGKYGSWLELLKFASFVAFSVIGVALVDRRWPSRAAFGLAQWPIRYGVLLAIGGFVLYEVAVVVFEKMTPGAVDASNQVRDSLGIGKSPWVDVAVMLAITVGAPVGEEFLCRGLLFRSLRDSIARTVPALPQWIPLIIATLGSAYFFMQMHGGEGQDLQLYMIGLLGVLCALAYAVSGSLRAPVLIHGLNNSYAALGIAAYCVNPKLMWCLAFLSPVIVLLLLDGIERLLRE